MDDFEARAARWRVRHLSSFDMAHDGVILGIRMALSQAQASCSFMRTAVDRVGRGKDCQVNARFSAMVSHYLFDAEFCNPASGWEKEQVEKNVRDARHRLWQPTPSFADLNALNAWLEQRCIELRGQIPHGAQPGTIANVWAGEAASLMPPPRPFDGFVEHAKRVSPTCLVHLERNRYSVPASFANRPVSVRVYPERIVVAAEGRILCEHQRIIERSHHLPGRTVYDWRHYLAVIQRKPGALRNGRPLRRSAGSLQEPAMPSSQAAWRRQGDGRGSASRCCLCRGSASLSVLFDLIGCASVIIHVDANEIGLGSWAECAGIGRRA